MNTSLKLFILFLFKTQIDCSTKIWRKDPVEPWTSITNAPNECMKAVFNRHLEGFLSIDREQRLNEVILPSDGAIVISSGSKIEFSGTQKCDTNNVYESNLTTPTKRLWFSTKSWIAKDENENVAKPDIYKIPCECDTVEFPKEYAAAAVDLEFVDEIVVDKILINDRTDDFEWFLETPIGQKMFSNSEAVHFSQGMCTPPQYCGCHNHNRFEKYTELLCVDESKYCPEAHCLQPIQPKGHCCPICGAILNFKIKNTCEFNLKKMAEVDRKIKRFRNGKYANKLNYYAGMVPGKRRNDNFVQLVVAEVGEYTGISVDFMNYLTKDEYFKEDDYRKKIASGIPYIRGESSIFLIMALTLIFVLSIYGFLYVHYVRAPNYQNWVPISRLNVLRKSIAFARFENRSTEDGNDAIDVGVRYEEEEEEEEEDKPVNQTVNEMNNPLYEREQVTFGSVETEMLQPATSQTIDEPSFSANDIKLVDISLKLIKD